MEWILRGAISQREEEQRLTTQAWERSHWSIVRRTGKGTSSFSSSSLKCCDTIGGMEDDVPFGSTKEVPARPQALRACLVRCESSVINDRLYTQCRGVTLARFEISFVCNNLRTKAGERVGRSWEYFYWWWGLSVSMYTPTGGPTVAIPLLTFLAPTSQSSRQLADSRTEKEPACDLPTS